MLQFHANLITSNFMANISKTKVSGDRKPKCPSSLGRYLKIGEISRIK